MTANAMSLDGQVNPKLNEFKQAQDCLLVAQRYGVTRKEQDQAAVGSHKEAAAATAYGKYSEEIVPVTTKIVDPKTGEEKKVTISVDDGIRPETSLSGSTKLKPVFKKDGSTTAVCDGAGAGAGAVLLMRRDAAMQRGLPIIGVFRSFAAVGVDSAVMGIGPAVAILAAVKSAGLQIEDIDLFEINEAFASQYTYILLQEAGTGSSKSKC